MATTAEVLRSVPLFEGMTDRAVEAIAGLAEEVEFPAGSEMTREGYPGESFIVILAGRATVDVDGRRVRDLSGGDYLGEISLIDGGPRTATVTATESVQALIEGRLRPIDGRAPGRPSRGAHVAHPADPPAGSGAVRLTRGRLSPRAPGRAPSRASR